MKEKPIYEQFGYDPDPPFYAPTSKPTVTNYDRLISKTTEEMAEFITNTQINTFKEVVGAINKMLGCEENTLRQIREEVSKNYEDMVQEQLDWLKQEADNGEN